ncbi:MAG: hypothetical protein ACTJGR_09710 [Pauljensenia sp.]
MTAVVLGLVVMHAVTLTAASSAARHSSVAAMTHSAEYVATQAGASPVSTSVSTPAQHTSLPPQGSTASSVLPDMGHGASVSQETPDPVVASCVSCAARGAHSGALMTCALILLITLVALVPPRLSALGARLARLTRSPAAAAARLSCPRAPSLLLIGVCRT